MLNEATSSIHDLIQAGKEMEILKDEFINKCQKSLKPWFDISYAFQVGKQRDLPQNVSFFPSNQYVFLQQIFHFKKTLIYLLDKRYFDFKSDFVLPFYLFFSYIDCFIFLL